MMSDPFYQDLFKVKYQDKYTTLEEAEESNLKSRILVPLSLGSSSVVLLDILNDTLNEQIQVHRGKVGFQVDVLICYFENEREELEKKLEAFMSGKLRDNRHIVKTHFVNIESFMDSPALIQIHLQDSTHIVRKIDAPGDKKYTVNELLSSCSNRSAREDLLNIIRTAVIKQFAAKGSYKAVLWGHSMTRLADEIISLVVKGRASQILKAMDDSSFDEEFGSSFKNLRPMRDILLSEIDAYCHLFGLSHYTYNYVPQNTLLIDKSLYSLENNISESRLTRNMTINELARQYFVSIEDNYSNLISTVVRTGAKLDEPSATQPETKTCGICRNNLYQDGSSWLRNITVTSSHLVENEEEKDLYNAWKDSEQGKVRGDYLKLTAEMEKFGHDLQVCYGCILTLGEVKHKNIYWPKNQLADTLEEFVLTDDDEEL